MMLRFLTGRSLLIATLSGIERLVEHLHRAVQHIEEDMDRNHDEIARLERDNADLLIHRERASRVANKFRELVA